MAEGGGERPIHITINLYKDGDQMRAIRTPRTNVTNIYDSQIRQIRTGGSEASSKSMDNFTKGQSSNQATSTEDVILGFDKMNSSDQFGDNYFSEERAEALIKASKFNEAINLLEVLPPTQRQQVKLLECYFQIGMDSKVLECIENMRMLVMRYPRPKAADVYELGLDSFKKSAHVQALTHFACAAKMYSFESDSNEAVRGMKDCASSKIILAMIEQNERMRVFACEVGMKIMNSICDDITKVNDADPGIKARMETLCLNNIGVCYKELKRYEKAIEFYQRGIDIMNHQFGKNSSKYQVFGGLLGNTGLAYLDLGNYSKAESFLKRALEAFEKAKDHRNEEAKRDIIKVIENNMSIAQMKK